MKYVKFTYGGTCILEVRGDGHQSLIPPAGHPSGQPYVWIEGPHQPPTVPALELAEWAEDVVVAFALSAGWNKGSRHDLALAAAGWMARRHAPIERALRLIEAVAEHCADPELVDRLRAVDDTYERVARDEPATGFPTLERLLSREAISLLRQACPRDGDDDEERAGIYRAKSGRVLLAGRARGGEEIVIELANFDARILRDVRRDDGSGDIQRVLELGGSHAGGGQLPVARVGAEDFAAMAWIIPAFGAGAVVTAGQGNRDRLREAIQRLSGMPPARTVYTHTGWREIGDKYVFLHAGLAEDVQVELDGALQRYRLPAAPRDLVRAIRTSLALLDLGDRRVTVPLWCTIYLAPLASILHPDLTLWLWGPTGVFKSTLAALFLCHFGEFDRKSLPADWSSTDNMIERLAFLAKDVPLVIDEFAPPPSRIEQQRLTAKASRLLRAQGNLAGRGRMRADTSLRSIAPPRGVLISTAETPPPLPASAVARTLVVEVPQGAIDPQRLAEAQRNTALLADAMAAYIAWIADHYAELSEALPQAFRRAREAQRAGEHGRTPEMIAHLEVAAGVALRTFVELGGLTRAEAEQAMTVVQEALHELGVAQDEQVQQANPARRFADVLGELFAKKAIYCAGRDGDQPPDCEDLGWIGQEVRDSDGGTDVRFLPARTATKVGWADDDWLYLLPKETYRQAFRFLGDTDQVLGASEESLGRALHDAGVIEVKVVDGKVRRTVVVKLEGSQRRVWKLRRATLGGGEGR